MDNVTVDLKDTIAVLQLNNGTTNAISSELITDLSKALKDVQTSCRGIVLSGNDKFFSMGFNLPFHGKRRQ